MSAMIGLLRDKTEWVVYCYPRGYYVRVALVGVVQWTVVE